MTPCIVVCPREPLSEQQASWYAHAGSDLERQDIAMKLALTAFSREAYNLVRDYCIEEYEKDNDVSGFIDFDKSSVIHYKDRSLRVRAVFAKTNGSQIFLLRDEDARAYSYAMEHHLDQVKQITMWLAIKYLRKDDGSRLRQNLRYDDIYNYDSRKEKYWLAKEIATEVRKVSNATPGTPAHANVVTRQLCTAAFMLRSALTVKGGSGYGNREDELKKHKGYEEEIEEESQLTIG